MHGHQLILWWCYVICNIVLIDIEDVNEEMFTCWVTPNEKLLNIKIKRFNYSFNPYNYKVYIF